ncbi:uncharacterized protein METZ01_LOCUS479189 [marine metagenome]|uniref:Uncharacterized protein n=1 Tax=marine metagenome TaxID=408172 RepID=A0A383C420_9ZZZZ
MGTVNVVFARPISTRAVRGNTEREGGSPLNESVGIGSEATGLRNL